MKYILSILICFSCFGGQVKLAWDPSPSTNVVGYAIYYGYSSGNYSTRVDAGINLFVTITNLITASNHFFVATAYTEEGIESLPSNEVSGFPSTNVSRLTIPSSLKVEKR